MQVRGTLDVDRHIVKVLLAQTSDVLLNIGRYVENPSHAVLGRLLNAPSNPEDSVDGRIDALSTRLRVCETAEALASKLELFDQVSFGRMAEALECVDALVRADAEIQSSKIVQGVLGGMYGGEATDEKLLVEIISLAEGIAESSSFPESIQTYLFSHQFNERIGRLYELHEDLCSAAENVKERGTSFKRKLLPTKFVFLVQRFTTTK